MTRLDIDRADIQALAYTGFGSLTGASYLLLRVTDPPLRAAFPWRARGCIRR